MDAVSFSLTGWRNAPFPPDTYIVTDEAGDGIPLADKTFAMDVRRVPGEGPALISLDMAPNESGDGIWVVDATEGEFRIQIGQLAMQAAWDAMFDDSWIKAGMPAVLYYDLLVSGADDIPECWFEGTFTILPGVTL